MTTVLLAFDETDASLLAGLTATMLFGAEANYLAVHVEPILGRGADLWGPVYGYPFPALPAGALIDRESRETAVTRARLIAAQAADAAGVDAAPIGEVGDPAEAILRVAQDFNVDVVVVGDHDRSWFRRLLERSVADELVKIADLPILLIPSPGDQT